MGDGEVVGGGGGEVVDGGGGGDVKPPYVHTSVGPSGIWTTLRQLNYLDESMWSINSIRKMWLRGMILV